MDFMAAEREAEAMAAVPPRATDTEAANAAVTPTPFAIRHISVAGGVVTGGPVQPLSLQEAQVQTALLQSQLAELQARLSDAAAPAGAVRQSATGAQAAGLDSHPLKQPPPAAANGCCVVQ